MEAAVEAEVSSSSSTVFTRLTDMSADPNPRTRAVVRIYFYFLFSFLSSIDTYVTKGM